VTHTCCSPTRHTRPQAAAHTGKLLCLGPSVFSVCARVFAPQHARQVHDNTHAKYTSAPPHCAHVLHTALTPARMGGRAGAGSEARALNTKHSTLNLNRSVKLVASAEEIGLESNVALKAQSEQMKATNQDIAEVDEGIRRANTGVWQHSCVYVWQHSWCMCGNTRVCKHESSPPPLSPSHPFSCRTPILSLACSRLHGHRDTPLNSAISEGFVTNYGQFRRSNPLRSITIL